MSLFSIGELKGQWKQQVSAVRLAWDKLTEEEILQSEGRAEQLASLIEERYALTRDQADKQVSRFFDKAR